MSDTASIRIYQIREGIDLQTITDHILNELHYAQFELDANVQQTNGIELLAFVKSSLVSH
jgi:hypothetical protein